MTQADTSDVRFKQKNEKRVRSRINRRFLGGQQQMGKKNMKEANMETGMAEKLPLLVLRGAMYMRIVAGSRVEQEIIRKGGEEGKQVQSRKACRAWREGTLVDG